MIPVAFFKLLPARYWKEMLTLLKTAETDFVFFGRINTENRIDTGCKTGENVIKYTKKVGKHFLLESYVSNS